MNNKYHQLCWGLLLGVFLCGGYGGDSHTISKDISISSQPILNQGNKYFCDVTQNPPILIGRSDLGNVEMIVFENHFEESIPVEYCKIVAERFNNLVFSHLSWMRSSNGERVIIATKYEGDLFRSQDNIHLLFTLKKEDIVHGVLESLNGILSSSSQFSRSKGSTKPVRL